MTFLWRNKQARSVLFQVLALAGLFAALAFFAIQVTRNLELLGLDFNFAFLNFTAGYDINQTLISYDATSTHLRALYVGLLNTLLVAFMGVIVATILGFIIGVMRLSKNFLLSRIATVYIEFVRNVPLLLQILLIYGVIVNVLPHPKEAWHLSLFNSFFDFNTFLSNRGMFLPKPVFLEGSGFILGALILGIIGTWSFTRYAKRVQVETGKVYPVFGLALFMIVCLPFFAYLMFDRPINFDIPTLGKFNLKGGMNVLPEFLALWLALSIYTAAFIAEIVRSGIMSVSHGQTEAAHALGLRPNRTLRLVTIPQAMRVIIPPLTSQYLNLTKNSSLAIAVGYMDMVATIGGITMNQTGRAMECMLILLSIYLMFSLLISLFMNWYNNHIKLIER